MGWEGLFRQVLLQYAPSHAAHTGRHPVSSHHSTRPAVYTASGGVYVEDNGGDVDETSYKSNKKSDNDEDTNQYQQQEN